MKVYLPQDIAAAGKDYLTERGYELIIGEDDSVETTLKHVGDVDALLVRTAKVPKEVIDAAPKLKVVSRHGIGVDAIDLDACRARGIKVTNGPLSNANAVAEHIVAYVMACAYRMRQLDEAVRSHDWDIRNRVRMTELEGKTVGMIGLGHIGGMAAQKMALGLGMKIIAYSRHLKDRQVPEYITVADSLDELLEKADFVSLNCPSTPETRGMINKETLAKMKPTAYLINCARGELVNEDDLYDALKNGVIQGAAVDVLAQEPIADDCRLIELDNIIFSPHCSAHSNESFDRMALHAAMGLDEVISGRPITWEVC